MKMFFISLFKKLLGPSTVRKINLKNNKKATMSWYTVTDFQQSKIPFFPTVIHREIHFHRCSLSIPTILNQGSRILHSIWHQNIHLHRYSLYFPNFNCTEISVSHLLMKINNWHLIGKLLGRSNPKFITF